jgi:hypothetical protein
VIPDFGASQLAAGALPRAAASGEFKHASLQVNFNTMPLEPAQNSLRLFARAVMPRSSAARRPV